MEPKENEKTWPLNYEEASRLVEKILFEGGTGDIRREYLKKFKVGSMADRVWNEGEFVYGIEYGILIALYMFYGKTILIERKN